MSELIFFILGGVIGGSLGCIGGIRFTTQNFIDDMLKSDTGIDNVELLDRALKGFKDNAKSTTKTMH